MDRRDFLMGVGAAVGAALLGASPLPPPAVRGAVFTGCTARIIVNGYVFGTVTSMALGAWGPIEIDPSDIIEIEIAGPGSHEPVSYSVPLKLKDID